MHNDNIRLTSDGELAEPVDVPAFEPDLGQHLRQYRENRSVELNLAIGVGLLMIFIGIAGLPDTAGFVIIALGLLFVGIIYKQRSRRSTLVIDVYQDGMRIQRINAPVKYVFWADVTNIDVQTSGRNMYLTLYRGRRVIFDLPTFPGYRGMGYVIQRQVNNALLDYYRESLDKGNIIDMGPVKLRDDGIVIEEDVFGWGDIQSVTRSGNHFRIMTPNKSYRLTITDNQRVIETLISEKRRLNS